MISLSEAEAIALRSAGEMPVRCDDVLSRDDGYFFPVEQIGTLGIWIDGETGQAEHLGSAFPQEDWFWGLDRGIRPCRAYKLRILELDDIDRATNALLRIVSTPSFEHSYQKRRWVKEKLARLPAEFEEVDLWSSVGVLRGHARQGLYAFEIQMGGASNQQ